MCSPVVTGAAVAGGALQAYGQIRAGQAANAAGIRENNNAKANALVLEAQGRDALDRGAVNVDKLRLDAARTLGEGRAGFASGNVDLSSGAAAYWELDQAKSTAADVRATKYASSQEDYGFRVGARNERARGVMARYSGQQALASSYLGASGTVLSTAGQVAGRR